MRRRIGFSLVELLCVVAVLAVLIGILVPVLARAKERSKKAIDISNLRQIGQAQAIYNTDDRQTYSVEALVSAGLLSRSVVSSPRDDVLGGRVNAILRNYLREKNRTTPVPTYEIGYLATGEFGPDLERAIPPECDDAPRRGWVIDLAEVKKFSNHPEPDGGVYNRLLKDGSITRASTGARQVDGGLGFRTIDFFMDVKEPCASAPLRP